MTAANRSSTSSGPRCRWRPQPIHRDAVSGPGLREEGHAAGHGISVVVIAGHWGKRRPRSCLCRRASSVSKLLPKVVKVYRPAGGGRPGIPDRFAARAARRGPARPAPWSRRSYSRSRCRSRPAAMVAFGEIIVRDRGHEHEVRAAHGGAGRPGDRDRAGARPRRARMAVIWLSEFAVKAAGPGLAEGTVCTPSRFAAGDDRRCRPACRIAA